MPTELFQLTGKTALVTGGSRGLGLAIATGLAEHGADIALLARDTAQMVAACETITAIGRSAWSFECDLHELTGLDALFDKLIDATSGIDILVNCAGITRRAPAEDVTPADWNEVIQINLTAAFAMSQAFCRHRKKASAGGKIINIGSLMCRAARPTTAAYTASKGGLLAMTKACAVEWAKYDITVNAIGPGYFMTELTQPLVANEQLNQWVISNIPLGRWGRPDELVGTAVFLSSSASDFVTGQIVYVDGGWLAGL